MIPSDIDIVSMRDQINADGVAIGQLGIEHPTLEPELQNVAQYGLDTNFGRTAFVILDHTPPEAGATRDVAQELLNTTDFDTIIVRAPGSGAVVSHDFSRAALEAAQYDFLSNPEIAPAARQFIDTLNGPVFPWMWINIVIAALLGLAIVITAIHTFRYSQAKTLDRSHSCNRTSIA